MGSLNQSQLDELKDAISDPGVFNMSSYLYDMTCWALDRGMESLITTNPFDLALASLIIAAADQCNDDGVTYASGAGDYAEWLPRFDESEKMSFGQIVGVTGGAITKNTEGAEQLMVVSMNPIVLGNMPPEEADEKNYEKVAFMGQVPVWIIGKVQSGDYLLPSGKNDGFAIAVSPEKITLDQVSQIVGRAWEDGENPINLVNTVVGVKTNEMAQIMKKFAQQVNEQAEKMNEVEARLGRIEAALAN